MLYEFAFVLDPRAKLDGFGNALDLLDADVKCFLFHVHDNLSGVYGKYKQKYAKFQMQWPSPAPTLGKKSKKGA